MSSLGGCILSKVSTNLQLREMNMRAIWFRLKFPSVKNSYLFFKGGHIRPIIEMLCRPWWTTHLDARTCSCSVQTLCHHGLHIMDSRARYWGLSTVSSTTYVSLRLRSYEVGRADLLTHIVNHFPQGRFSKPWDRRNTWSFGWAGWILCIRGRFTHTRSL